MQNVNEMRTNLSELYSDLKSGKVDRKDVKELTNICGKMINSAMVQVKYYAERKEVPKIAFLDEPRTGRRT